MITIIGKASAFVDECIQMPLKGYVEGRLIGGIDYALF